MPSLIFWHRCIVCYRRYFAVVTLSVIVDTLPSLRCMLLSILRHRCTVCYRRYFAIVALYVIVAIYSSVHCMLPSILRHRYDITITFVDVFQSLESDVTFVGSLHRRMKLQKFGTCFVHCSSLYYLSALCLNMFVCIFFDRAINVYALLCWHQNKSTKKSYRLFIRLLQFVCETRHLTNYPHFIRVMGNTIPIVKNSS